jgi:hypothetical protein
MNELELTLYVQDLGDHSTFVSWEEDQVVKSRRLLDGTNPAKVARAINDQFGQNGLAKLTIHAPQRRERLPVTTMVNVQGKDGPEFVRGKQFNIYPKLLGRTTQEYLRELLPASVEINYEEEY